MEEEILELCRAMGAGADQEELLLPLIRAVTSALAGRLRSGVVPEDCGSAFPLAAAMISMDGLNYACGGGGVTSFTAGEVSVRTEGGTLRDSRTEKSLIDRLRCRNGNLEITVSRQETASCEL